MANDLAAIDVLKPDGATQAVSVLDDYERETRDVLVGWAGQEHDLAGRHKFSIGNTAARPAAGVAPVATGTIYVNTQLGILEYYDGSTWRPLSTLAEPINYVFNGGMELWNAAGTVACAGWTRTGALSSVSRNTSNVKEGSVACNLIRVTNDCNLSQDVSLIWNGATWWRSKLVTIGAWVRVSSGTPTVNIQIDDGIGTTTSSNQSAGTTYEWLSVSRVIDSAATSVTVRLRVVTANGTAQFDGVRLSLGYSMSDFLPGLWSSRIASLVFGDFATAVPAGTTRYMGQGTFSSDYTITPGYRCVIKALYVLSESAPGGGQTFTYTARKNATTDLAMTVTVSGGSSNSGSDTNAAHQEILDAGESVNIKVVASGAAAAVGHQATLVLEIVPTGI